jgi:hypothetical protein
MNKIILGISAMALVLTTSGLVTQSIEAYRGDPAIKGPDCSEERHAEMTKAFETKNYDAWKDLMDGKGRVTEIVNKNNFSKFAEAHKVAQNGDLEEAKKIRQEIGLGVGQGHDKNTDNGENRSFGRRNSLNQ